MEAPGTAPGSEWLIPAAVYRHSQPKLTQENIWSHDGKKKVDFRRMWIESTDFSGLSGARRLDLEDAAAVFATYGADDRGQTPISKRDSG